jgi:hypothetical protein
MTQEKKEVYNPPQLIVVKFVVELGIGASGDSFGPMDFHEDLDDWNSDQPTTGGTIYREMYEIDWNN